MAALLLATLCATPAFASSGTCSDLTPAETGSERKSRTLVIDDLVRLRDIGPSWTNDPNLAVLGLSPDRTKVAFQLRRADPATNSYCLGMYVMDLRPGARPVQIDRGGELIRIVQSILGVTGYPSGYTQVVTPRWSPNGMSVAFLRRDRGITQVWRARADGSQSGPATHIDFDAEQFAWSDDGTWLIFAARPALGDASEALEAEGRSGFLFDDRYIPFSGNRPFPREPIASRYFAVSVSSGEMRDATAAERGLIDTGLDASRPANAIVVARGPSGQTAWSTRSDPTDVTSRSLLHVKFARGSEVVCDHPSCDGVVNVANAWWSADGSSLFYLRESWARSEASLFRWSPKQGAPRRILQTEDALLGCQIAGKWLVCAHEASRQPRRLVLIDLATGAMLPLFDPNPEFASVALGTTERLHWTNSFGIENFGDLVLPPDHEPGRKHPLIVVQYETRGFLRGGTDDEYPIHLFAAHGFAVLSFQHPMSVGFMQGARTREEISRIDDADWTNRRSIQSSLEAGLHVAVSGGAVDAGRMGITGLSEGSNMVQFAWSTAICSVLR